MKVVNGQVMVGKIARRQRVDMMTPAEKAILVAQSSVSAMGLDSVEADAIIQLLVAARTRVSNIVDARLIADD